MTIHELGRDSEVFSQQVRFQYGQMLQVKELSPLLAMLWLHRYEVALHSWRVSHIAEMLARRLHFTEQDTVRLVLAAQLHDIGKLSIPAQLLHTPHPLTPEEWAQIQSHPERGQQILLSVGGIGEQLAPLVVAHHECWDGSGYPHGLKGNNIPLGARLLAVADAYDAMCSERSYRRPLDVEEIKVEVKREEGYQFDPQVCKVFLRMLDEELDEFSHSL